MTTALARRLIGVCVAGMLFALVAAGTAAAACGDVSVFAPVLTPGYPALPHVVGDRVYEGT